MQTYMWGRQQKRRRAGQWSMRSTRNDCIGIARRPRPRQGRQNGAYPVNAANRPAPVQAPGCRSPDADCRLPIAGFGPCLPHDSAFGRAPAALMLRARKPYCSRPGWEPASRHRPTRPRKPMIEMGGRPILWHIMKLYAAHGVNDFIICLGHRGYLIKEYFANYFLHMSDVSF